MGPILSHWDELRLGPAGFACIADLATCVWQRAHQAQEFGCRSISDSASYFLLGSYFFLVSAIASSDIVERLRNLLIVLRAGTGRFRTEILVGQIHAIVPLGRPLPSWGEAMSRHQNVGAPSYVRRWPDAQRIMRFVPWFLGWPTCSPHDVSCQEKRRKMIEGGHTDSLMAKRTATGIWTAFFKNIRMDGWMDH